ncbi:MAG: patatin-like phospholipase family protein [Aquificota bacterium]|nr:patatin-like phospholipase family protein [Aquificota bacterium]
MKVALALSGGAARGVAHIGVIKALEDLGYEITALSGSSAGALVAVFYASGYTPEDMLRAVKDIRWVSVLKPSFPKKGLIRWDRAVKVLEDLLGVRRVEDLKRKVFICATDLLSARSLYFDRGDLVPLVLGSCSLPGIFEPVRYGEYLLIDGGIMNNLPVEPLAGMRVLKIGVDVNPLERIVEAGSLFRVLLRSFFLAVRSNVEARKGMCDLLIVPDVAGYSPLDIRKTDDLFRAGYEATVKALSG